MASLAEVWSSDYRFTVDSVLEDGERYVAEWTATGTNDQPGARPARDGQAFELVGVSVGRRSGNRIAENRDHWNMAAYLMQIGLMPHDAPA